jgi:hypothetical protein
MLDAENVLAIYQRQLSRQLANDIPKLSSSVCTLRGRVRTTPYLGFRREGKGYWALGEARNTHHTPRHHWTGETMIFKGHRLDRYTLKGVYDQPSLQTKLSEPLTKDQSTLEAAMFLFLINRPNPPAISRAMRSSTSMIKIGH